jgi:vacuolar protein sorting-associated protein 33A
MQALTSLQNQWGIFPRIVGKGDHAAVSRVCTLKLSCSSHHIQRLANLMAKNLPTTSVDSSNALLRSMSDKLDCLIVIDRRVDLVTPLLTQLTYEGLVDEVMGIKNCKAELTRG